MFEITCYEQDRQNGIGKAVGVSETVKRGRGEGVGDKGEGSEV